MGVVSEVGFKETLHLRLQAVRIDVLLHGDLKEGILAAAVIQRHRCLQWNVGCMDACSHLHHHSVPAVCLVYSYHGKGNITVRCLRRYLLSYGVLIILAEKPRCRICRDQAGILSFLKIRS